MSTKPVEVVKTDAYIALHLRNGDAIVLNIDQARDLANSLQIAASKLSYELMSKGVHPVKDEWIPANGGHEEPFNTRTGRRVLYVWNPLTGQHAHLDLGTDMILTGEEEKIALGW